MHIEKLDVDFQQTSKHAVADSPIWRPTAVRYAGPDKNESRQKFIPFRAEGSQRELTTVRGQTIARMSTAVDCKPEQVQTFQAKKMKMIPTVEIQMKLQLRCHIFIHSSLERT